LKKIEQINSGNSAQWWRWLDFIFEISNCTFIILHKVVVLLHRTYLLKGLKNQ